MIIEKKENSKRETIRINSLSIGYKTKNYSTIVATGINTKLFCGELTCLLGANGVGKSTLLKTLSAFLPKMEGSIEILGRKIESYSEREISTTIGVILTDRSIVRNMSVNELVSMGRYPYTGFWGRLNYHDNEKVSRAIEEVHIENLRSRKIDSLSDGELQKAMIAKVLAQETPIVFLDEPTAFLDYPSKVEIMQFLRNLSRESSKTIFISTHDLELALQIADRIWLMDRNNGITAGIPEDLALNGFLNNLFAKKGIFFDLNTGLFKVSDNYHAKIKCTGHGQQYAMVRKALQRNGIEASSSIESEVSVEAVDSTKHEIIIRFPFGKSVTVKSIENMLDAISNIPIPDC